MRRFRPASFVLVLIQLSVSACSRSEPGPQPEPIDGTERDQLDREYRELTRGYNERTGARLISAGRLITLLDKGSNVVLLDIREPDEHAVSSLPNARLLPPGEVSGAHLELPPDSMIVTYCTAGYRSGLAAVELERRVGRPVYNLDGGIISWFNSGGEVRNPAGQPTDKIHPFSEGWARYVQPRPVSPKKNSQKP